MDTEATLYALLSARLTQAIKSGTLRTGERLPSVRAMARQEHVSVSTVLAAYLQLENAGLVETRPQSGHYVKAQLRVAREPQCVRPAFTPTTVKISALVTRMYSAAGDPALVPLGAAVPHPSLLPTRQLHALLARATRLKPEATVQYLMPPGLLLLRQQIARRALAYGCSLSPADIIITHGASEAMHLSLMATSRRGDTIAVESPAYYGTLQAIEALGLKALEIPAQPRTGMDLDALEEALAATPVSAVLVVPNFSNPLGSSMPDANKKRLVELLARRDIPLIEDDIYGDLAFNGSRPRVCRSFDDHGRVLLCSSFSKTLAPGYRVGWVAPGRYRGQVELLKFAQSVGCGSAPQYAVAEFLQSGGYDRHLRGLRRHVQQSMEQMVSVVTACFPEGTAVSRPEGGFVLWVEMPRSVDALALHSAAFNAGIIVTPGPLFSARDRFKHCIRLNCASPWTPKVEAAVRTLGHLACQQAGRQPLSH